MEIAEFQKWVENTDRDTQWDLLTTLQLLAHLTEEVGELAQSINRIYGYAEERERCLANMGGELVDVFWFLVKLASKFGVDLDSEAQGFIKRADRRTTEAIEKYRSELMDSLRTLDKELSEARSQLDLEDKLRNNLGT